MINPLISSMGSYILAAVAIGGALLVAFGKDFLKVSIALFVELLALCGLFLTLGAEYLAIFTLLLAVFAPIVVMSFASVISGNLQDKNLENTGSPTAKALRYLGFLAGVGIGISVALVIIDLPLLSGDAALNIERITTIQLGQALLGEHVLVFELMAVMAMSLVIGAGILLRRAR